MIVLKIIGIALAVFILLITLILALRVRICFEYTPSNPKLYVRLLFLSFGKKKPVSSDTDDRKNAKTQKKPNKLAQKIKKLFGIDVFTSGEELKQNVEEKGISGTAEKVATVITLIAGQLVWLLKRFRLDKLKIIAVCAGDDAADAAMDYGVVCSAVYPLVGYLTSNIKTKKNADDVRIYCDFEGKPYFETEITVSVRIIHLVRAVLRNANEVAKAGIPEEAKI